MKKLILLSAILFNTIFLFGQDDMDKLSNSKDLGITLNYVSQDFSDIGIEVGFESSMSENLIMSYQLGFYSIGEDEPNTGLYWKLTYRPTLLDTGYSPELSVGIGFSFILVPSTFPFSSENQRQVQFVLFPTISLGLLGYDFREKKDIPLRIFSNVMFCSGKNASTRFQVGATYFID